MKPVIQHLGTVKEWKFVADNPSFFLEEIKKHEGKRVSVIVKAYRPYKQRSIEQNSYWHGVICKVLSDETGHTPEEIHEILKFKFLAKDYELKGKHFTGVASTASLSTIEFEDLCSRVRSWSSMELGCYLPAPNESPIDFQNLN